MPSRQELVVRANAVGVVATNYPNDSKLEQKVLWAEKRATTFAGSLATGVLTSDATQQADGDKVTIGDITYTFKTALSEAKATNTLTSDATNVADGETVTIDGITYTFRDTISSTAEQPYAVLVGANAQASLANLLVAIQGGATAGTNYGLGTAAHPTVDGVSSDATTLIVRAKNLGTYANGYVTLETSAHLSWAAATLGGATATVVGVNPVPYEVLLGVSAATELDNLKAAINNDSGVGTTFSTGTPPHPQVTATTNTNTEQTVQAIDYSVTNASIATTDPVDTGNHMSWGAATLASGVAKVVAANTTTAAGGPGLSGDKNV